MYAAVLQSMLLYMHAALQVLISIFSLLGYGPNQVIAKRTQKTLENASLKRTDYTNLIEIFSL